ncbi:MAG: exosortase/archaeosortase family protein [Planctomyces sp.]|nr:exosortase/archaeosortase family protein [Planctomyces sp.]
MSDEQTRPFPRAPLAALALVGLAVIWSFWPLLRGMADQWERSPDYSHGWIVPLLALALLWSRRVPESGGTLTKVGLSMIVAGLGVAMYGPTLEHEWLGGVAALVGVFGAAAVVVDWSGIRELSPSWLGLGLILAGGVFQVVATKWYMEWFERLALLPMLAGCMLLVGGRKLFLWTLPAVAFLVFMVPLPYTLETALRDPLRQFGTNVSTYLMQTFGLPAYAEGNVIVVDEKRIGVVEACSGLRMLMVFFALSTATAYLLERPWWQRGLILLGAIPVALISNIFRITLTGTLHSFGWDHLADLAFHDLAGWMMMPLGLALLLLEVWFLDQLIIVEEDRPMAAGLSPAAAAAAQAAPAAK